MATSVALRQMQDFMQAFIVHQGVQDEALESAREQSGMTVETAESLILPSKTLTPVERLEVYRGMYFFRMRDALAADYEAVQHFLGEDEFDKLVENYIEVFPSRSYTLNRLSDHLPDYIETAPGIAHRGFVLDLARLELAIAQVFEAAESPTLTAETIQAIAPDAWEFARLKPIEAARLGAYRYPVNAYLQAVLDNRPRPKARRGDEWILVYRQNNSTWRSELTKPAYELLSALMAGTPLGEAIETTCTRFAKRGLDQQVFKWFNQWVAKGIFQSVEFPETM